MLIVSSFFKTLGPHLMSNVLSSSPCSSSVGLKRPRTEDIPDDSMVFPSPSKVSRLTCQDLAAMALEYVEETAALENESSVLELEMAAIEEEKARLAQRDAELAITLASIALRKNARDVRHLELLNLRKAIDEQHERDVAQHKRDMEYVHNILSSTLYPVVASDAPQVDVAHQEAAECSTPTQAVDVPHQDAAQCSTLTPAVDVPSQEAAECSTSVQAVDVSHQEEAECSTFTQAVDGSYQEEAECSAPAQVADAHIQPRIEASFSAGFMNAPISAICSAVTWGSQYQEEDVDYNSEGDGDFMMADG